MAPLRCQNNGEYDFLVLSQWQVTSPSTNICCLHGAKKMSYYPTFLKIYDERVRASRHHRLPAVRKSRNKNGCRQLINNAGLHNQRPVALPVSAGEMRNDLYVTLERGEFEKGGKSVARNVEVTVHVLDVDGQVVKVSPPHPPPPPAPWSLSHSLSLPSRAT